MNTVRRLTGENASVVWQRCPRDRKVRVWVESREKEWLQNLLVCRANPRNGFNGGRTNTVKLYHHEQEEEQIHYYDFTLLYSWLNMTRIQFFTHVDPSTIKEYFGLVKSTILSPGELYHPVLPYREQGKLTFPLCSKPIMQMRGSCSKQTRRRIILNKKCGEDFFEQHVRQAGKTPYKIQIKDFTENHKLTELLDLKSMSDWLMWWQTRGWKLSM